MSDTSEFIETVYNLNDKYKFDDLDTIIQDKFSAWKSSNDWSSIDTVLYNFDIGRLKPKTVGIIVRNLMYSKSNSGMYKQFYSRAREIHGADKINESWY